MINKPQIICNSCSDFQHVCGIQKSSTQSMQKTFIILRTIPQVMFKTTNKIQLNSVTREPHCSKAIYIMVITLERTNGDYFLFYSFRAKSHSIGFTGLESIIQLRLALNHRDALSSSSLILGVKDGAPSLAVEASHHHKLFSGTVVLRCGRKWSDTLLSHPSTFSEKHRSLSPSLAHPKPIFLSSVSQPFSTFQGF